MMKPRCLVRPCRVIFTLGALGALGAMGALGVGGTGVAAAAEPRIEDLPGYLPFAELAILPHQDLKVEINLEGALLDMIGAASGDDPEMAKLMSGLKSIRVQVANLKDGNAAPIHARLEQTAAWLDQHGWKTIVRSHDKEEEDFIYVRESGGAIVGLTVLTFQPGDEAAVINIVGRLDPAQIGRLGRGLHLPQLEHVPAPGDGRHANP
jgi:hypothetical protein